MSSDPSVRRALPSRIFAAASAMRTRPVAMIGLAASGPPDGFTATSRTEAERLDEHRLLVRERSLELGDLDRCLVDARRLGRQRADSEPSRSRMPG